MLRRFERTETDCEENLLHPILQLTLIAMFLCPRRAAPQYSSEGNASL